MSTIRECSNGWSIKTTGYKTKEEGKVEIKFSCADGFSRPTLNTAIFPNTENDPYWSSSFEANTNRYGTWVVNFYDGKVFYDSMSFTNYVRLVRSNDKELSTLNNTANTELVAMDSSNEATVNKKILQNNQQTIQLNGKWRCGNGYPRFTIKDKYWRFDSTVNTNDSRVISVAEGYLSAPDVITIGSIVTFASESESICAPEMAEQMGSPDGCLAFDPKENWLTWVITKYSKQKLYINAKLNTVHQPTHLVCSKF